MALSFKDTFFKNIFNVLIRAFMYKYLKMTYALCVCACKKERKRKRRNGRGKYTATKQVFFPKKITFMRG